VHFAVRQRARGHGLPNRRPVLPLQEPGPVAPGPGHERPVDRQPIHRASHVRPVLQAGRVLRHQAENDEPVAAQDTAILQEVPARLTILRGGGGGGSDARELVGRLARVAVIIIVIYTLYLQHVITL